MKLPKTTVAWVVTGALGVATVSGAYAALAKEPTDTDRPGIVISSGSSSTQPQSQQPTSTDAPSAPPSSTATKSTSATKATTKRTTSTKRYTAPAPVTADSPQSAGSGD